MKKCLLFRSAGHDFLIEADKIIEVFDADSSPEKLGNVLVGDHQEVYWRGKLAFYIELNQLLESSENKGNCYIACILENEKSACLVIRVDQIQSLIDVEMNHMRPLNINNNSLQHVVREIYIFDENDKLGLLIADPAEIYNFSLQGGT